MGICIIDYVTMSESTTKAVLYRLKPDWGLPSVSIACLQVEVSRRMNMIEVQFTRDTPVYLPSATPYA